MMRPAGLEPATPGLGNQDAERVTPLGSATYDSEAMDWVQTWVRYLRDRDELTQIIEHWDDLSQRGRDAIVAVLMATKDKR